MQSVMTDLLTRFVSDPILLFWRSFGMILEGNLGFPLKSLCNCKIRALDNKITILILLLLLCGKNNSNYYYYYYYRSYH